MSSGSPPLALALFVSIGLGIAAPAEASAQQQRAAIAFQPYVFVSDRGDSISAERGHVFVPESRSTVGSRPIDLTFVRLPSRATKPGAPIVYLAGGPGGSAQLAARGRRFAAFNAMRDVADVILFDQRGTYGSNLLQCPESRTPSDSAEWTEQLYLQVFREWSAQCIGKWKAEGVQLTAYNVVESADDLEALRSALGVPRLSLWAISYGTQLAQVFAQRHASSLERMILAGPEPLDGGVKMPSESAAQLVRLDSALATDSASHQVMPSLLTALDRLLKSLDSMPARAVLRGRGTDSTVVRLSRFDLQFAISFGLGNSAFLKQLPKLIQAGERGEFSGLAQAVVRLRHLNTTAMALTTDCATGFSASRLLEARRQAAGTLLGMAANFPFLDICPVWPRADLQRVLSKPWRATIPTLFIVGTMDGRTPPSNAVSIRRHLPVSTELLLRGASHDDDLIISTSAIVETMQAFLRGERVPNRAVSLPSWTFGLRAPT